MRNSLFTVTTFIYLLFFMVLTCEAGLIDVTVGQHHSAGKQDTLSGRDFKKADCWFAPDKGQHLLGSMIVTIGTSRAYRRYVNTNKTRATIIGCSVTLSLGLGKEIWDYFHPWHDASWKDLTADALGILLGSFITNIK